MSITADREVVMAAVERRSGVEVEWGSELKLGRSGGLCITYVSDVILLS